MENRVFGCKAFSDIVFNTSISLLEKILDHVLEDQQAPDTGAKGDLDENRVFKIGFYAHEASRTITVMCEIFENDDVY